MFDLNFRDAFTGDDAWANNSDFKYTNIEFPGIFFSDKKPFFMCSNHPEVKRGEFLYSTTMQFAGRSVTQSRARSLMNGGRIPIQVKMDGVNYLMAKGFCAHITNEGKINPLFIAMDDDNARSISDITFYIASVGLTHSRYKQLKTILLEYIINHTGDVLVTPKIEDYFGAKIKLPRGKTVAETKKLTEEFVDAVLSEAKKTA